MTLSRRPLVNACIIFFDYTIDRGQSAAVIELALGGDVEVDGVSKLVTGKILKDR